MKRTASSIATVLLLTALSIGCAAMHGSPYSYDSYVPVIFYGAGIAALEVLRAVEPASIAPTLAGLLGIKPPSGASASVLAEVRR